MRKQPTQLCFAIFCCFLLLTACSKDTSEIIEELNAVDSMTEPSLLSKPGMGAGVCQFETGIITNFEQPMPDEDGSFEIPPVPEGITVDNKGNVYVGFANTGEIIQLGCDGQVARTVYKFDGLNPDQASLLGLTTDPQGNIYACVNDFPGSDSNGVWRIDPKSGIAERLPGTAPIFFPNMLTFDNRGNLYVTSTLSIFAGSPIYVIPKGGEAVPWITENDDPENLLTGVTIEIPEEFGGGEYPPLGANGIVFANNKLFVNVTTKKHIVEIPILLDGSPGTPSVLRSFENPDNVFAGGLDGITVDKLGNIYVTLVIEGMVMKVTPDGQSVSVISDPGSDVLFPASLTFSGSRDDPKALLISNFNIGGLPIFFPPKPGVVKLEVDAPGKP